VPHKPTHFALQSFVSKKCFLNSFWVHFASWIVYCLIKRSVKMTAKVCITKILKNYEYHMFGVILRYNAIKHCVIPYCMTFFAHAHSHLRHARDA
jgi:hypothetical protein